MDFGKHNSSPEIQICMIDNETNAGWDLCRRVTLNLSDGYLSE